MPASINSIPDVLHQMNQLASAASSHAMTSGRADVGPSANTGFATEFKAAIDNVSAAQRHASTQARHFELGTPGVNLNDVMIDMQKASLGFQSLVQVRNKLVSAYQTIANMPL